MSLKCDPCEVKHKKKNYTYDDQNQLTSDGTNSYDYDENGNCTNYTYQTENTNQIAGDGTWQYTYDLEGNVSEKLGLVTGVNEDLLWRYTYDHANHLTKVQRLTNGTDVDLQVEFKYDIYGNRVEKSVDADGDGAGTAEVLKFALDGWNNTKPSPIGNENWDVLADLDGSSDLLVRYFRGDTVDQLLARTDGPDAAYLLTDHLGSIRDVIDNSGASIDAVAYDSFGNATAETSPANRGRYGWTGREYETEVNLQYNRARYYDSTTGRWISQDPARYDAGDSNLYRYVNNGSNFASDPSGLDIYYCINPTAVAGFGHAGMVIGPIGAPLVWNERVYNKASGKVETVANVGPWSNKVPGNFLYISVGCNCRSRKCF